MGTNCCNNIVIFHSPDFKSKAIAAYLLWIHRKLIGVPRDNIMLFQVTDPTHYELPFEKDFLKGQNFFFADIQVHPLLLKEKARTVISTTPYMVYDFFAHSEEKSYPHVFPEILDKMFTQHVKEYLLTDEQMEVFRPHMDDTKQDSDSHWDRIRKATFERIQQVYSEEAAVSADGAARVVTIIMEEIDKYITENNTEEVLERLKCYPWYATYLSVKEATTDHHKMLIGHALFPMMYMQLNEVWRSESELLQLEEYRTKFSAGASIYNTDVDHVQFWFTLFDEVQPVSEEQEVPAEEEAVPTPPPPAEADTDEQSSDEKNTPSEEVAAVEEEKKDIPPAINPVVSKQYDTEDLLYEEGVLRTNVRGNYLKLSGVEVTEESSSVRLRQAVLSSVVVHVTDTEGNVLDTFTVVTDDVKSAYPVEKHSHGCGCGDDHAEVKEESCTSNFIEFEKGYPFTVTLDGKDHPVMVNLKLSLEYNEDTHDYIANTTVLPVYCLLPVHWNSSYGKDLFINIPAFTLSMTCSNPEWVEQKYDAPAKEEATPEKKEPRIITVQVAPDMTNPRLLVNQVYQAGCAILEHTASKERYIARSCFFPMQITAGGITQTLVALNTPPTRAEIVSSVMESVYDGYLLFDHVNRDIVVVVIDMNVSRDEEGANTLAMETWFNEHMITGSAQISINPTADGKYDHFAGSFLVTRDVWNGILNASEIDRSDSVMIPTV